MKKTINELLAEAGGQPILYGGKQVRGSHKMEVPASHDVQLRFLHASAARRQGLSVKVDKGAFAIAGAAGKSFILWADSAPDIILMQNNSRGPAAIHLYNSWSTPGGGTDAFIGNAGIIVDVQGGKTYLRCSDGLGEATFDDLAVEIVLVEKRGK